MQNPNLLEQAKTDLTHLMTVDKTPTIETEKALKLAKFQMDVYQTQLIQRIKSTLATMNEDDQLSHVHGLRHACDIIEGKA